MISCRISHDFHKININAFEQCALYMLMPACEQCALYMLMPAGEQHALYMKFTYYADMLKIMLV